MKYWLTVLGISLLPVSGFAAESTFQHSCSDIKLSEDGSTITASCKKRDGSISQTSIPVKGVQNIDGKLTVAGGETNYQQSCATFRLQITKVVLTAICKTKAGKPSNTQVALEGIDNVDGVLTQN